MLVKYGILRNVKKIVLFIILLIKTNILFAQFYTEYTTPAKLDTLVKKIFGGYGVTISNVSFQGYHFSSQPPTAPIEDIGKFIAKNVNIGIDSGIILTSGKLDPPYGLSKPASYTSNFFKATYGDKQLDSILNFPSPPDASFDAAVLEFDFIPIGDSIKFEYVFASEEYNYNVCNKMNDVFAFFISGPGIIGCENIAIVPGTNYPVSINSINNGHSGNPMWNPANCISLDYSKYYIDHTNDSNFIFNGSTTVLTAISHTIPCNKYHLKFAVADVSGSCQDSGVLLKANSFNSEPLKIIPSVSYSGNDTVLYEGCGNAKLIIRRTYNIQKNKTYKINTSGTAINGIDYTGIPSQIQMNTGQMYDTISINTIADTINSNNKTIDISIGDTLCNGDYYIAKVSLLLKNRENINAYLIPNSGVFCDKLNIKSVVKGGLKPYTYDWNSGTSNDSTFSCYFTTPQNIILKITDKCMQTFSTNALLTFSKPPEADFSAEPEYICIENPVVHFYDNSSSDATSWYWNFGNNNFSNDKNPTNIYNIPSDYMVKLISYNNLGCADTIEKEIIVHDKSSLLVPNIFTPNGDGKNDIFKVKHEEEFECFNIKIFDRWGSKIYETTNINNGWDAHHHTNGTYYYIISAMGKDGKEWELHGNITVIR